MVTCCKNCPNRHERCHSTCKTYLAELEKHKAERENGRAEFERNDYEAARRYKIRKKMEKSKGLRA